MNRINLICLGVRDMARALKFYRALGFKTHETAEAPPIVFFDTQGTKLELFPLKFLAEDINKENPPTLSSGGFNGMTLAINMKSKEEVDQFFALVEQHGGDIVKSPEKPEGWDGYSGYFRDLDGYYWEVAYGKNWSFDENDMLIID